eukprot:746034-Hanusia_phi.AAC.5
MEARKNNSDGGGVGKGTEGSKEEGRSRSRSRMPDALSPQVLANQFLDIYQKVDPSARVTCMLNVPCRSTREKLFQQPTTSGGCCARRCVHCSRATDAVKCVRSMVEQLRCQIL